MSFLNNKGPENKGSRTGRGLGKCKNPNEDSKNPNEFGKGMGMRRNSPANGRGMGRRSNNV